MVWTAAEFPDPGPWACWSLPPRAGSCMAFVAEARRWLRELAVTLVILAAGALLAVALIIEGEGDRLAIRLGLHVQAPTTPRRQHCLRAPLAGEVPWTIPSHLVDLVHSYGRLTLLRVYWEPKVWPSTARIT